MKSSGTENNHPAKPSSNRSWVILIVLILGLPLLFYYGYCWGLWGRSSLLLQYLFQCNCPPASEEARYPEQVDVIVSACRDGGVKLSPSGRLLYVREKNGEYISTYVLDLQTQEKIKIALLEVQGSAYFLTDDLMFVSLGYGGGEYVLDLTMGKQYPIQEFTSLHPEANVNGIVNLGLLAEALNAANLVFLINDNDTVVALAPDFTASESNFLTNRFDIPGMNPDRLGEFLQANNISYQPVLTTFPDEAISLDRRFIARPDGIYLVETGQKAVEGYSSSQTYRAYSRKYFAVRGWTDDGVGVIYSKFSNPCLIETSFLIYDDPACYYEVPQPVIKLKVPEEYLLPKQTP